MTITLFAVAGHVAIHAERHIQYTIRNNIWLQYSNRSQHSRQITQNFLHTKREIHCELVQSIHSKALNLPRKVLKWLLLKAVHKRYMNDQQPILSQKQPTIPKQRRTIVKIYLQNNMRTLHENKRSLKFDFHVKYQI